MKKRPPRTKSARLAEKLLQIRVGLNLSQTEILDRLGFSDELFRSNISQYERGDRVPPPHVLLEYARLANVSTDVLIDDKLDLPQKRPTAGTGIRSKPTSRKIRP